MNKSICERIGDAERIVDGRLDAAGRASFAEHAENCHACTTEVEVWRSMDEAMRGLPSLETSATDTRRERARLLRALDGDGATDAARIGRRHAHLMFAATLVTVAAFFIERNFYRSVTAPTSDATTVAAAGSAPAFDVVDVGSAVWKSEVDGYVARTSLTEGVASFHVQKVDARQRFLLALPDGEIEVHGTRFVVSVHGGTTTRVEVTEGVVALRLRGSPELLLHAGDHWPATPAASEGSSEDPSSRAPLGDTARGLNGTAQPSKPRAVATNPSTRGSIDAGSLTVVHDPRGASDAASDRFVAATGSFQRGSYAQADSLLAAFLRDFPQDPRCEDASFLRAVAHARLGDHQGAADLATGYLQRFPNGLRRPEAEQLVRER